MLSRQFTTVPNTSNVRAFTSESAIVWVPPPCQPAGATDSRPTTPCRSISCATSPDFFASSTKSRRNAAPAAFFRRADRLLHGGELPVENARARARPCHLQQARAQPGIGVHLLTVELLERGGGAVELQQLRLLDVVFEPEPVSAPRSYRDTLPGLVDLGDIADRRARRHEIGRLDLAIGGGEVDYRGALRFGADQADVPNALLGVVGDLAWAGIGHVLHRHAEAGGDRRGHVGGDPGRVARRALSGNQEEIAHVDRRAQNAGRGKLGYDFSRHGECVR